MLQLISRVLLDHVKYEVLLMFCFTDVFILFFNSGIENALLERYKLDKKFVSEVQVSIYHCYPSP